MGTLDPIAQNLTTTDSTSDTPSEAFRVADERIPLFFDPTTTFRPNPTTSLVYGSVVINPGETGIDMGAGIGPGSIYLAKFAATHDNLRHIYSIEAVPEQVELLAKNVKFHGLEDKIAPQYGRFFSPMGDQRVDFIVSDISGMNGVGVPLGWYPSNIPLGGTDGADNAVYVAQEAPRYLNQENSNARLYFPIVVQFSDGDRIQKAAQKHFSQVKKVAEKDIPLMEEQLKIIERWVAEDPANNRTFAPFKERGATRKLWTLEVYEAKNPIYDSN